MSHILVVDDEADVRLMLRLALRVQGHDVDEVGSGAAALEALDAIAYDGVVLDIHLPDMSGWEVLDRIRRRPTRADTPVLLVTADVSQPPVPSDRDGEAARAHARLMYKPLDPHELVDMLEEELETEA